MNIKVNGKNYPIENDKINITKFLEIYGIKNIDNTAVEYNENIIKKEQWDTVILKENDVLEIVSFVGGG